ncbi:hypothetical protein B0T19DRAFT_147982 [Cercophora scortea]|uniref:Uncharacterized protein n=1 Tax=Cercophora scortea TaxID=314031 RepID=A0AAE0IZH7_9PEZI|nr:hypothetical protein B0T19DRAFT_147982 [Cercophora scortea]
MTNMLPLRPKKQGSWLIIKPLPSNLLANLVVIVHGFSGSWSKAGLWQEALEEWLADALASTGTGRDGGARGQPPGIMALPFDMTAVLHGETSLDALSAKLRKKIEGVIQQRQAGRAASNKPPSLVFVAHGLGAWVVKNMLSLPGGFDLAFDTVGAIFLDATPAGHGIGTEAETHADIVKYLRLLSEKFNAKPTRMRRSPPPPLNGKPEAPLARKLQAIEANFDLLAYESGEQMMSIYYHMVWMDKPVSLPASSVLYQVLKGLTVKQLIDRTLFKRLFRILDTGAKIKETKGPLQDAILGGKLRDTCITPTRSQDYHTRQRMLIERSPKLPESRDPAAAASAAELPLMTPATSNQALPPDNENQDVGLLSSSPLAGRESPPVGSMVFHGLGPTGSSPRLSSPRFPSPSLQDFVEISDTASMASAPLRPNTPPLGSFADEHESFTPIRQAEVFFQRGKYDSAEFLYTQGRAVLGSHIQTAPSLRIECLKIDTRLAVMALYRGRYGAAEEELRRIHKEFQDCTNLFSKNSARIDQQIDITRWLALSLLKQGKYQESAECLEDIIQENSATEIRLRTKAITDVQVRRDLGLAYAYLGDYVSSASCLAKANERVNQPVRGSSGDSSQATMASSSENLNDFAGRSSPVLKLPRLGGPRHTSHALKLKSKADSVLYATAILRMLMGLYQDALDECDLAYKSMRRRLGTRHVKFLEVASLKAYLLALNSRFLEAEASCQWVLQIMMRELDNDHPLTLETRAHLVFTLIALSRNVQATSTAQTLHEVTSQSLGATHPITLRARNHLAKSYISNGQYEDAVKEFLSLSALAKEAYYSGHPDTLRYRAELAAAYCLAGKIEAAESIALDVMRWLRIIYTVNSSLDGNLRSTTPTSTTFGQAALWVKRMSEAPSSENLTGTHLVDQTLHDVQNDSLNLRIHPSILFTLQILADAELQKPAAKMQYVERILTVIVAYRSHPHALGESHVWPLETEFRLALIEREEAKSDQDPRLVRARDRFRAIYRKRAEPSRLGPSHPATEAAKRELILTNLSLGVYEAAAYETLTTPASDSDLTPTTTSTRPLSPEDLDQVEAAVREIAAHHKLQLGMSHPETLRSFTWLFAVQMLLGKEREARPTYETALHSLQSPDVRAQRPIESLRMERRLALIFSNQDKHVDATLRFRSITQAIATAMAQADKETQASLASLRHIISAELASSERSVAETLKGLEDSVTRHRRTSSFALAESSQAQIVQLRRALDGETDGRALEAIDELAALQWAQGSLPAKRIEAIDLLSGALQTQGIPREWEERAERKLSEMVRELEVK